ncbi:MAG: MFS transporter [Clostridia bacterium]|nr:MFS transporter [Clostridia bacterium]
MKKQIGRGESLTIFLCWLVYTAAYVGRYNFVAYLEPIRDQIGAQKEALGLVTTFFSISYGAGQLVHGILSRKYNTRFSVTVALLGSAAVNAAMTVCPDAAAMKYVWLVNGAFQAILWSSLIKTLSDRLSDQTLPKAIVVMSSTAALGTFLAYGMSVLFSWRSVPYRVVFFVPAVLMAAIGVLWFLLIGKADDALHAAGEDSYVPKEKKRPALTPAFVCLALLVMFAAVANGFIKDGVTTWTPSILKENYGLKDSLSIFVTLLLPLIAIFGAWISTRLHKRQKNTSVLNGMLYFAETATLLLVMFVSQSHLTAGNPVFLIVLFAMSALLMMAVNNVITSIIPMYLRDTMDSGLLAGVLDTFCYVGSAMSGGLLGYIADHASWNSVFLCLTGFGAAACAACWVSAVLERKRAKTE